MGKIHGYHCGYICKITIILLVLICFMSFLPIFKSDLSANASNGSAYIVMCADNLKIYKEENKDLRLPMASTTKIMTALLTVENCDMNEIVTIPNEAVGIEGSSIYLKAGEKLTVKELLYGLMLRSGNDAAVALAVYVAGKTENFVEMMNLRAEQLGLTNTHFVNPHGLHDKNHFTSAYDLCYLGCISIKNPIFKEIVSTKFAMVGQDENVRYWKNKNKILFEYDGGIGIKTGFTKDSGRCLVACAERNGVTVVSVALNRYDYFNDCKKLMDHAFNVINRARLEELSEEN